MRQSEIRGVLWCIKNLKVIGCNNVMFHKTLLSIKHAKAMFCAICDIKTNTVFTWLIHKASVARQVRSGEECPLG